MRKKGKFPELPQADLKKKADLKFKMEKISMSIFPIIWVLVTIEIRVQNDGLKNFLNLIDDEAKLLYRTSIKSGFVKYQEP